MMSVYAENFKTSNNENIQPLMLTDGMNPAIQVDHKNSGYMPEWTNQQTPPFYQNSKDHYFMEDFINAPYEPVNANLLTPKTMDVPNNTMSSGYQSNPNSSPEDNETLPGKIPRPTKKGMVNTIKQFSTAKGNELICDMMAFSTTENNGMPYVMMPFPTTENNGMNSGMMHFLTTEGDDKLVPAEMQHFATPCERTALHMMHFPTVEDNEYLPGMMPFPITEGNGMASGMMPFPTIDGEGMASDMTPFPINGMYPPPMCTPHPLTPVPVKQPENELTFAMVPGRLGLLNYNKRRQITVAEIRRRIDPPEGLNISLLNAYVRKAKNKQGLDWLMAQLEMHQIHIPAGRRKLCKKSVFMALFEEEAITMAKDFNALNIKYFPTEVFLLPFLEAQATFINELQEFENSVRMIDHVLQMMRLDNSPLTTDPLNPPLRCHPQTQESMTKYVNLTHGYGNNVIMVELEFLISLMKTTIIALNDPGQYWQKLADKYHIKPFFPMDHQNPPPFNMMPTMPEYQINTITQPECSMNSTMPLNNIHSGYGMDPPIQNYFGTDLVSFENGMVPIMPQDYNLNPKRTKYDMSSGMEPGYQTNLMMQQGSYSSMTQPDYNMNASVSHQNSTPLWNGINNTMQPSFFSVHPEMNQFSNQFDHGTYTTTQSNTDTNFANNSTSGNYINPVMQYDFMGERNNNFNDPSILRSSNTMVQNGYTNNSSTFPDINTDQNYYMNNMNYSHYPQDTYQKSQHDFPYQQQQEFQAPHY